ncbi:MAG TPA: hypothetical protein PKA27_13310 [Fimbriimonadaceae bacterium]|nr:hypothetical protein [Fimbriimonadaceae bacterium]
MKRLLAVCSTLGIFATAMALSTFSKVFHDKYDVKAGSNLAKAACSVCHVKASGGKLNAYGKDLQNVMKDEKSKKLTAAMLAKVENLDSDKDGTKNGDEIKKDSNPGL